MITCEYKTCKAKAKYEIIVPPLGTTYACEEHKKLFKEQLQHSTVFSYKIREIKNMNRNTLSLKEIRTLISHGD